LKRSKQQTADSRKQTADSRQQKANSKQQTANSLGCLSGGQRSVDIDGSAIFMLFAVCCLLSARL
jgi:hypothetical protein